MKITDEQTGRHVPVEEGKPRWRPRYHTYSDSSAPVWWGMFIPHLVHGVEIGSIDPDITVYPNGKLLMPGQPAMMFDHYIDAMKYAEATYLLEEP